MRPVLLGCILLAACLNPLPEEFPSDRGDDGAPSGEDNSTPPTANSGSAGSGGSSGLSFGGAGGTAAQSPASPYSPELPPSDDQPGAERTDAGVDGGSVSDAVGPEGDGGSEP